MWRPCMKNLRRPAHEPLGDRDGKRKKRRVLREASQGREGSIFPIGLRPDPTRWHGMRSAEPRRIQVLAPTPARRLPSRAARRRGRVPARPLPFGFPRSCGDRGVGELVVRGRECRGRASPRVLGASLRGLSRRVAESHGVARDGAVSPRRGGVVILPRQNELDYIVWRVQAEAAKAILRRGSMPFGSDLLKLVERCSRYRVWKLACDSEKGPGLIATLRRLIPLDAARPSINSEWWWSGCIAGHSGPRGHMLDGDVSFLMEMLHSIVVESVLADLRGG